MEIVNCYETGNDHILREAIKYSERNNAKFCVLGNYIMSDKKLEWDKFRYKWQYQLKQREIYNPKPHPDKENIHYGFRKIGDIKINKWYNNRDIKHDIEYVSSLQYNCLKLEKRKNNGIVLHINKKRYKLNYSIHLMRYFYKRKDKEFFEKDYNILTQNIERMENKYYKYNMTDKYYNSKRRNNYIVIKPFFDNIYEEFDFELFYKNYFIKLTCCQQKVFALILLGVRITDISRLLGTSEVYISLEKGRIMKKINKMYKKYKISPYKNLSNDDISEGEHE
jgi:hypothetical protein